MRVNFLLTCKKRWSAAGRIFGQSSKLQLVALLVPKHVFCMYLIVVGGFLDRLDDTRRLFRIDFSSHQFPPQIIGEAALLDSQRPLALPERLTGPAMARPVAAFRVSLKATG